MEELDLLKMAGFSSTGIAIVLIVYRLLKSIQGKKLVSSCCGKKLEVGVAVADMTPKEFVIRNPIKTGEEKQEEKEGP